MIDELKKACESLGLQEQQPLPADFKVEPWMVDFVKQQHVQEEWDAFFWYCEASPFERALSRIAGFLSYFLPVRR